MAATDTESTEERLTQQRRGLPDAPGVYLFRDEARKVLYVGKARSMRKRVAGHFSPRAEMIDHVRDIEFIATETEAEALLAEQEFIKRHRPVYNVRLRDDKSYPYIGISLDEEYPRTLLHARAPPPQPRLFRPFLQRQARPRDARPAGQGIPVPGPATAPSQTRPAARPVSFGNW